MTRAMNSLVLTRAHYRRRYGSDAPEMSIPSRFLEEVPSQLIENLGSRSPAQSAWATPGYPKAYGRRTSTAGDFADRHYNYEDENQEAPRSTATSNAASGNKSYGASGNRSSGKPFVASWMTPKASSSSQGSGPKGDSPEGRSIDNIARFFGGKAGHGKPGSLPRPAATAPAMDLPASSGTVNLKKGQHVRHAKYGEGTVLLREGDGEAAKLTILFNSHGVKKLMEKFANLRKI
jgi:DNA helicase-2/ATP-dependent DNA helicase PcrA